MKHIKKFQEFIEDADKNADPKNKPAEGNPETTAAAKAPDTDAVPNAESPSETPEETGKEASNTTSPDSEEKKDVKADTSETPATDAAEDTKKKEEDDTEIKEGNAFVVALMKAKEDGLKEFEFQGKKYPIREAKNIATFDEFISESFAVLLGSTILLNNEIVTHDVNMSVYGKPYIVNKNGSTK